ncbi:MAG: L-rhamnose mutarotase, partial [Nitrospina sp.]|nr:L-rhamnose mutarotase [Nitrospina sp.]
MIYQALALKLKTGGIKKYIRHHDQISSKWPKLQSALKESGILSIRTFEANPTLL